MQHRCTIKVVGPGVIMEGDKEGWMQQKQEVWLYTLVMSKGYSRVIAFASMGRPGQKTKSASRCRKRWTLKASPVRGSTPLRAMFNL